MSTTVTYKGNVLTTVNNQTRTLLTSGKYMEDNVTLTDVPITPSLETKSVTITPTESSQSQTILPTSPTYDGLSSVSVTVNAISSTYVGSGITRRSSSDLTTSGATVSAPAGYYENAVSKSVASGTEGTPVATKGTVSNHSISITPSVTNTAGYISGGTVNGTAVSVSAAELVSGTKSITQNGTGIDVTNYASVDVAIPSPTLQSKSVNPSETAQTVIPDTGYDGLSSVSVGAISNTYVGSGITIRSFSDLTVSGATVTAPAGYYESAASKSVASGTAGTPTATKGTVSNHSVTITPSVTNTTGYITGSTKTGTAVTVTASELVSGSETKTANGTYDVTNLASVTVALTFNTIYSGQNPPSSSLGNDGDVYLQM